MLNAGTKLSGRYEILSTLGAGGMGVVYRARDLRLDRDVAIKILPDHLSQHHDAMTRFEREAKALAALSHSSILSIFDFASDQGVYYAVMELLKGQTLRTYLSTEKPSWQDTLPMAEAIADGLAAAHSQGVIHRDLKPENVFLTTDGKVKILDFGLARLENPSPHDEDTSLTTATATQAGVVMGTLPYMSPEQVRGQRVDARTDIFSFGCMLFEMLTGARAFSGSSHADIVASVLKEDPVSRVTLPADLPPGLVQTVTRCLEKNPDQRFQSAKDLAFALHVSEGSGKATTIRLSKPISRSVSVKTVVLCLAALVALLAGAVMFRFLYSKKEIQSLAVMPFVNGTKDPETEYLSDGITETLISSLSRVPNLRVMAHDTVFSYKGKAMDPRKVGAELQVEAVVTGRVVQQGNVLVIYANLVKVEDGSEMWGDQYNKTLADLLTMQADISREISTKLRARLTGEEKNRVTRKYTENNDAYQLYLKGEFFFWKFTREDYEKAREYYRQAIEKDPNFAQAWAAYADTFGAVSFEGYGPPKEYEPEHKEAAKKALSLDPLNAHAHLSMGGVHFNDWNWRASESEFRTAIRLDPNRPENHRLYSQLLRVAGRWKEAVAEAKKAHELDPLSFVQARSLGIAYFWAGQYDKAIEVYQKALELEPNRATIHDSLSDVYAKKGMFKEAIEEKQRLLSLSGDEDSARELGQNFEKYGYQQAKKILTERYLEAYQQVAEEEYVSPLAFAVLYVDLNEKDKAFEMLEKAYEEHSIWLIFLKTDPQFESLRSDPRFASLVKRIGIT